MAYSPMTRKAAHWVAEAAEVLRRVRPLLEDARWRSDEAMHLIARANYLVANLPVSRGPIRRGPEDGAKR